MPLKCNKFKDIVAFADVSFDKLERKKKKMSRFTDDYPLSKRGSRFARAICVEIYRSICVRTRRASIDSRYSLYAVRLLLLHLRAGKCAQIKIKLRVTVERAFRVTETGSCVVLHNARAKNLKRN